MSLFQKIQDENSKTRQERAASLPKESKSDFLSVLGDIEDKRYPIYMTGKYSNLSFDPFVLYHLLHQVYHSHSSLRFSGPTLYTLCTAIFDLDGRTLSIIEGNPKEGKVTHLFHMY